MVDQRKYEEELSAWECEQERQKVEFTITEKGLDADLRMPSPEVSFLHVLHLKIVKFASVYPSLWWFGRMVTHWSTWLLYIGPS